MKLLNKLSEAKRIFYDNFGSTYFMIRNGEQKAFFSLGVSLEQREIWVSDIKHNILQNLRNIGNVNDIALNLFHLAYLDTDIARKRDVISMALDSPNKHLVLRALENQKTLYPEDFLRIVDQILYQHN